MSTKTHIARQTERLKRGEINRRRFIMSALATGVTLPTATSLAQKAQAAQPKAGGVLRIGVASRERLADMRALATASTLLEVSPDGALVGDLAAAFGPSSGGQTWVFDLRKDVVFSDGTRLDAHTVVAALSGIDTPGIHGQIKAWRADGPNTVVVDLIHPNPDFAWVLTDPRLSVRAPSGAGSGVYQGGSRIGRLEKVKDHWKTGHGHFDSVDLIPLPDPAARLTALVTSEIDLMDDVDPGMVALLDHTPDIRLIETEDAAMYGLMRQPGTDRDIGRALGDATDRRDLAHKVLLGHGRPCGLTACGPRSTVETNISIAPGHDAFPGARDMLALIARMARNRGLGVTIDGDTPQFTPKRLRLRPTLDWTLSDIAAQRPNQQLTRLIHEARGAQSADETLAVQEKAMAHLEHEGHVYPLIANDIHAHRSDLVLPHGRLDPLRVAERGWFG